MLALPITRGKNLPGSVPLQDRVALNSIRHSPHRAEIALGESSYHRCHLSARISIRRGKPVSTNTSTVMAGAPRAYQADEDWRGRNLRARTARKPDSQRPALER